MPVGRFHPLLLPHEIPPSDKVAALIIETDPLKGSAPRRTRGRSPFLHHRAAMWALWIFFFIYQVFNPLIIRLSNNPTTK